MSQAVKIAIRLPEDLLEAAERERHARGETRSEFFRHAVEAYLRQQRLREDVAWYVQGYQEQPETEAEIAAAERLSVFAFASEPWG